VSPGEIRVPSWSNQRVRRPGWPAWRGRAGSAGGRASFLGRRFAQLPSAARVGLAEHEFPPRCYRGSPV